MFNTINLDDVLALGEDVATVAYPTATCPQLQELFIAEALNYMAVRPLATDASEQQQFNKKIAGLLVAAPEKCPERLLDLIKTAIGKVRVANDSRSNSAFITAQTSAEMLLSFMNQLAGAAVRSAFFVHERAMAAESGAIDLIRDANQGFSYAGPRQAVVLPETAIEAIDAITQFLSKLYDAAIGCASQWFKGQSGKLQLGAKRVDGGWENLYTTAEVWMDIKTQRTQRMEEQAAARSAAFGNFAALIHGLEAADKLGKISDAAEPVKVTTKRSRKPAEPSATIQ